MATLILQNSALALVMRYTRVSGKQADKYIPTTAVVMAEIFKVVVALAMQFKVRLSQSGCILICDTYEHTRCGWFCLCRVLFQPQLNTGMSSIYPLRTYI